MIEILEQVKSNLRESETTRAEWETSLVKDRKDLIKAQQDLALKGATARQNLLHKEQAHQMKLRQQAEAALQRSRAAVEAAPAKTPAKPKAKE
jgi:hypothetical protein